MQVDRMFSAETAITIKQNKTKRRGGKLFNERVIVHCLIIAQRQRLVNILSKAAPLMDWKMKARKRETTDMQMEKGEKI